MNTSKSRNEGILLLPDGDVVVALFLVRTGSNPRTDKLLEIGAVLLTAGMVSDRYSTTIASEDPKLIAAAAGAEAPSRAIQNCLPLDRVISNLISFIPEEALCVAHEADIVSAFLRRSSGGVLKHPILDICRLAQLCLPQVPSHSFSFLKELFEIKSIRV